MKRRRGLPGRPSFSHPPLSTNNPHLYIYIYIIFRVVLVVYRGNADRHWIFGTTLQTTGLILVQSSVVLLIAQITITMKRNLGHKDRREAPINHLLPNELGDYKPPATTEIVSRLPFRSLISFDTNNKTFPSIANGAFHASTRVTP